MSANINGVEVSDQEYAQYDKFDKRLRSLESSNEKKRQELAHDLRLEVLENPSNGLRVLLWEMLRRNGAALGKELPAEALILYLTENAAAPQTPSEVLRLILTLPLAGIQHLQKLLPSQLEQLPTERRQVLETALSRLKDLQAVEARGQAGDADAWVAGWIIRASVGHYTMTSAYRLRTSSDELKVPPAIRLDVLRQLLTLNAQDHLPAPEISVNSIEQQRQYFFQHWNRGLYAVLPELLKDELPDTERRLFLERFVEEVMFPGDHHTLSSFNIPLHVATERERKGLNPALLGSLRRLWMIASPSEAPDVKWVADILTPELNPGEAWSDAFLARLDALPAAERQPWPALVAYARTATAGKPSAKWLKEGQKLVDAVGAETFRQVLSESLPLLSKPRTFPLREDGYHTGSPNLLIDEFNAQSLKGLLWLAPLAGNDTALARAVASVVDSALKKVAGVGPRAPKVANAAVYALSQMQSDAALSALARLNSTVTFKGTLKEVEKGLKAVAERLGTSPEDLLELGVPTLGLTAVGERFETWGDVEVVFTVDGTGAKLSFSKGGKPLKSVPASVKKDFADDLKELKAAQKEAEGAVSALAQRLDSLMISGKTWRGDVWQERYLNHPLAGTVARRLIWLVNGVPALWHEGELRTTADHALNLNPDSEIKLWHPLGQPVEDVLAWRDRVEELQIRQPFKQAWREVYLLTDAERRTGTYSNRFAGHILKQHQFGQLAALRGWRNKLRLMVDDNFPPATRDLPEYGLRAEYWIEGIGDDYGTDTTDSGSYLRVRTDQLRFYPTHAPENSAHASGGGYAMWLPSGANPVNPLPLEQIPALVLSEIMRDVDLFVGVASVGNDPTWQDGGPQGRFRDYWQGYSFGELTESAKTRAEYLARLIPRLKIKDRLSIEGRFLKVRGDRKTYKIHLGSSNILMEPNDQYLCIIPDSKGSAGPDVNFDGDRVLSLILSKAFLLADDTKITDEVILRQL